MSQEFLTSRSIPAINDYALSNILVDVDFIEEELKRNGRAHLNAAFNELRSVCFFSVSGRFIPNFTW